MAKELIMTVAEIIQKTIEHYEKVIATMPEEQFYNHCFQNNVYHGFCFYVDLTFNENPYERVNYIWVKNYVDKDSSYWCITPELLSRAIDRATKEQYIECLQKRVNILKTELSKRKSI